MNTVHTVWTGPGWYASRERGNEIEETVYFRRWDVGEVDASKINNIMEGNDWSELIAHVRRLGELSELRGRWCWHDCA